MKSVSGAIHKPLTVKVRIGFEKEPVDIVEIAKRIEDAGAAAIAVHGRTRQQYYSGEADWETIARIKEAVSIPVIGNGDVDSPKKADDRTLQETLEMCQIPVAPSYQEEKKAEYVRKKMLEAGLEDVHIDEVGNVLGTRKGISDGPRILLAGHTDTVFPMDTDLTLKQEGKRYSCPGIGDDTRAVAELLSIARALAASGIRGEGDSFLRKCV